MAKKKKRKCGRRGARNLCYRMGRGDNWFQALSNDRETVMGIKRSTERERERDVESRIDRSKEGIGRLEK